MSLLAQQASSCLSNIFDIQRTCYKKCRIVSSNSPTYSRKRDLIFSSSSLSIYTTQNVILFTFLCLQILLSFCASVSSVYFDVKRFRGQKSSWKMGL